MAAERVPAVEPIAVVGLACRVPGAEDAAQFWRNLVAGTDSVRDFSRAEQAALGVPEHELDDPDFVASAPVVDGIEDFDARLFGMGVREAEATDPHHRLMLEVSRTALEDAGYDPARFAGRIGVFTGTGHENYKFEHIHRNAAARARLGPLSEAGYDPDYVATLTSYKLGLRGPSLTAHTACSTSLVTLHLACESLRAGDCDLALAGGVHVMLPVGRGYLHVEGSILAPDGRCRPFDASGGGTIWGTGGGVAVLKPLAAALRDGDTVRAVVLGTAVNNDGAKDSFAGPGVDGQVAVVRRALERAGVDPRTVTYVEAHATGTAVGDPVEVAALRQVFGDREPGAGPWCGLGSVKSNVGHLSQAAGIAGVLKTVLALEHRQLPPTLHVRTPNPAIDLETGPFRLVTELSDWDGGGAPRRAGVSSFGVGGTNAHAVLEEAPEPARPPVPARAAHLLRLSARTGTALEESARRLAGHLADAPGADLADVAHTLAVGRAELPHRAVLVATDPADAVAGLADPKRLRTGRAAAPPRVAFLFSGQGSQHAGMGAGLHAAEPVYRAALDECADLLDVDLRALLSTRDDPAADEELRRTATTQPALFAVELALARLWESWGVVPDAMVGHSIGEYVAATLAGVFTVPDAVRLVTLRGRLMQAMPPGAMLAVQRDADGLDLPAGLEVAAVNAPGSCVVAGPADAIEAYAGRLTAEGVGSTTLRTSHAFHSAMMEPVLGEFTAAVAAVPRQPPRRRFLSNLTGTWITDDEATDPAYWARHLRSTVRFGPDVATLLADGGGDGGGDWALVECGPGRQLAGLARAQVPSGALPPLPSLPGPRDPDGDLATIAGTAGRLWTVGVRLADGAPGPAARRVPLPTYPYERRRLWIDPDPGGEVAEPVRRGGLPVEDWFAVPSWRQDAPAVTPAPFARCLALTGGPRGDALVAALRRSGVDVVEVVPGDGYGLDPDGRYAVRPGDRTDLEKLVADLVVGGGVPARVVHAWPLDGEPAGTDPDAAWRAQDRGFLGLLGLAQALTAGQLADPVHVDVLTAGTEDVTGPDLTRPEHATVAGVARVLPLEHPELTVRHVDADPATSDVDALLGELFRLPDGVPGPVALRGGRRWVRDHLPVRVPAPAEPAAGLRERGVYVVTGGLGGLGRTLAEDLARRVRARLVLVGRSEPSAAAAAAVRRMEEAGAEVLVLAADVTDPAGARRVRDAAVERWGRVDGLLHAAGVPGGGLVELKDRAVAEAVLAPKLTGTLALAAAFGADDLDVVVLFSSVTAIAGAVGQVDYTAANAFLDAAARARLGFRCRVVSVDWGGWLEVGMAAGAATPAESDPADGADEAIDHPLLSGKRAGGDGRFFCTARLSEDSTWLLREHRVGGVPVLPGTGVLELMHAAVRETTTPPAPDSVLELRDVSFVRPLAVPPGSTADVRVTVTPGLDGADVEVGAGPDVYAVATAAWAPPAPPARHDLPALLARSEAAGPPPAAGDDDLVTVGPLWPVPARVHVGDREQVALIEVGGPAEEGFLHPAVLDRAVAFPRLADAGLEGGWLPLGYGRLVAHRPLPARVWSHVRYTGDGADGMLTADVTVLDDEGTELAAISDFLLRRVGDEPGPAAPAPAREAPPTPDDAAGIRPADGAEAFARLLATDLGPQVVVSAVPIAQILSDVAAGLPGAQDVSDDELDDEPDGDGGEVRFADGDYVAPRTDLEATLARIWGEVLGIGQVGVDDDFFELGGNSLLGVQLVAQVRKVVGARLPMRTLFDEPTVAGIAAKVAALKEPSAPGPEDGPGEGLIPRLPRG